MNSGRTEQYVYYRVNSLPLERVFGEPLLGNGLFRVYSLPRERVYQTIV
jgi:hypothetical protein